MIGDADSSSHKFMSFLPPVGSLDLAKLSKYKDCICESLVQHLTLLERLKILLLRVMVMLLEAVLSKVVAHQASCTSVTYSGKPEE